ncbi:molybdopterin synthase sulfur carrier subunit [Sphingobacterium zeae]|uniref:Molybdopterin synthase sulfur carrier subunit n=1 Tax=Sphingobacterium zeae TaxID=1776859 RepID=A0ABU0UC05_9SPHI|nr:MoaD/ThiS family protein [Sphingobacterium zeae]MDQ1152385.1 molybdopterin synthase sulfur carrier subunit [Sphingobacterium zeae]
METTTVTLNFPAQLAHYVGNEKLIQFQGNRLSDLVDYLDSKYPTFSSRILDENGNVRPYLNFFIGEENIRVLDGLYTKLENNDTVRLLLSRAGG